MTTTRSLGYHLLAVLSVLAFLFPGGLLLLVTMSLSSPPGTEDIAGVLRFVALVSWLAFAAIGLWAWRRRSWLVVAVPFLYVGVLWVVHTIGSSIGWFYAMGD